MNNSSTYRSDILNNGFEQLTIPLADDYEGKVIATLVRRLAGTQSSKAVLYIHGFNDYFFQKELALQVNQHEINFYALDLRKYGRSYLLQQKFNDVRNIRDYYEEITKALEIIRAEGNVITTLMGHSTGGLISTLYCKDNPGTNLLNGLILNSPFYRFNVSPAVKLILPAAAWIGQLLPAIKISGGFTETYGKSLHQSWGGEWNYNLNWKPVLTPKVNLGWIHAIFDAQRQLKRPFEIRVPILLLYS